MSGSPGTKEETGKPLLEEMDMPQQTDRIAYTVAEAVTAARVSRAELYKQWASGGGPKRVRIGRRVLIRREALEEWLLGLQENDDCGASR